MSSSLNASISVEFASNLDRAVLQVEVDSRADGLNKGKTTFYPGDSPAFLVFKTQDVSLEKILTTQGYVQSVGSGSFTVEEWVTCAMSRTVNLTRPASGGVSILEYYGDLPKISSVYGATLTFAEKVLTSMKVSYTTQYQGYRVTGSLGDAPVIVYVQGVAK